MWEFITAGGPIMWLLVLTSIVSLAFIVERGFALRWNAVIPPDVEVSVENCEKPDQVPHLRGVCESQPSSISRLILVAIDHLRLPKPENEDAIQTRARHEVAGLERGLVILEIVVGIAPLLGLVGTIHGLITLFGDLEKFVAGDTTALAKGIAMALNTTMMGLLIAIPSLITWSYYSKKVDTLSIEMETLCDEFLRAQYREKQKEKG